MKTRIISIALLLTLTAFLSWAQLTVSSLRGTVLDPSGTSIPNAEIVVTDLGTGFERKTITNAEGFYEVADLQRGTYKLTIAAPGFTGFVADDVVLSSNQIRRIDAQLQIGSVQTKTTVVSDVAVINTEGGKLQGTVTYRDYMEKPWVGNGINPLLLLTLNPMVQNNGGIFGVQIAGQPLAQIQSLVDGVGGDSTLNGTNVDFYQEVDVATGNNSAEFPRAAQISMISRSGTNQFHGVLQYWNQTSALAARDFFAPVKPVSLTHNMTTELSGPVIRNRTFFLFSWEGQRIPASTYYLESVPTNAMRGGDFSQLLSGASPVVLRNPVTNAPFQGNIIPASQINPVSLQILQQFLPAPNRGASNATSGNYGFLFPYPTDLFLLDNYMARVDHRFNDKNTLFVRWQFARPLYVLAGNYPALFWTRIRRTYNAVVEDTHIISPRFLNTARFGLYQPTYVDGETVDGKTPLKGNDVVKSLGLSGINSGAFPQAGFPQIDISGYNSVASNPGGNGQNYKEWHVADTFTASLGRHSLRAGGELRLASQFNGAVPSGTFGQFTFNGSITKNAFADFLLGIPYSSQTVSPIINRTQQDKELGLFVQDTYRVSNRLTLDLGLRWDRFGSATYADNLIYDFDPTTGHVVVPQSSLTKISPLYPTNLITVTAGQARQNPSNTNFAPRIGAAYLINSKLVIRGAYGIFTETLGRFARAQGGGPYQIAGTFFNSATAPGGYFSFPNAFPSNAAASVASQSVSGFPPDTQNGRIHEFNATVEKQFSDIGLRLTYFGSRSRGMNYSLQINKPVPSATPFTAASRPYPQFVGVTYARNNGEANYNAFTVELMRKAGSFTFDGHYTLASNLNNMQNLQNPYAALGWNRDPATVRNRGVINLDYRLPVGKNGRYLHNMPAWEDAILGGWQIDWITYMESGQYFSPSFSGSDPSGTNTSGGLPDQIANGNLPSDQRSIAHWFNASAFAVPRPGTFGNSGANVLIGPGLLLNNTSVNKPFVIHERFRFILGVAVQNTFNHPNFALPASNISVPSTDGVITSTRPFGGSRQVMLRGRFEF